MNFRIWRIIPNSIKPFLYTIGLMFVLVFIMAVMGAVSSTIDNLASSSQLQSLSPFQVVSIDREPQIIGDDYFEIVYLYNNSLNTVRIPQSHVKVNQNKTELIGTFAYKFIMPMDSIDWELHVHNVSELK